MSRQRPLSPHLQIYKPQITSVLSILHRATGIALSIGSVILVLWIVALTLGENTYGIRHLFWDAGYGYDLKHAYISGVAVIISSLSLTSITWLIVYLRVV